MSETKTYVLIDNIERLSLARFIDCVCDSNLSVLVLKGEPSEVDLLECWANLYSQYLDVLGDAELLYIYTLQKEVELINFRITVAEAIVPILEVFHVEQLVQSLKDHHFNVKNLKMGHSGYQHNLRQVLSKVAHLRLRLKEKENELTAYYKDQSMDTVSRSFFNTQISRIGKFQGYPINKKTTMVPEYIAHLKEYNSSFKHKDHGQER
jgi:hypothetical protein